MNVIRKIVEILSVSISVTLGCSSGLPVDDNPTSPSLRKLPSFPVGKRPVTEEECNKLQKARDFLAAIPYWNEDSRKRLRDDEDNK